MRQVIVGAIGNGHQPDGVRLAHSTVHRLLRAEGPTGTRAAAAMDEPQTRATEARRSDRGYQG